MTTKFAGESNWDAIVNDNALDIEEEDRFREYIRSKGVDEYTALLSVLEDLYDDWEIFERNVETLEGEYKGKKILFKRVGDNADAYVYDGDKLLKSLMGYTGFVKAEYAAQKWIDANC